MDKKKVLFVVHQLNFGGVQKALLSALNAIDYERYDVTLYVRKDRLDLLTDVNSRVSQIIINDDHTHYYRKPYAVLLLAKMNLLTMCGRKEAVEGIKEKLSEYIAEQKIKYERKNFFSDGKSYDVAVSYIQGYPAKLVADYIEAESKIMFYHVSTDENHKLHESIFDRFDAIVGVNAGVQKVLEGLYPAWKEKMTYLENYVDAEEIRSKSGEITVDIPQGKTVLCSCGRLTPVKGMDLAVKAAKILKDSGENFIWYFVGDGTERPQLEAMIREYELEENIVITGMRSNPYPWMKACDIYVQPSREEAHPLTLNEAQILCKPIVSTKTLGGKLLIKEKGNGMLSEIDEAGLATTIAKLMHDSVAREEMQNYLSQIDYTEAYRIYQDNWKRLLEG